MENLPSRRVSLSPARRNGQTAREPDFNRPRMRFISPASLVLFSSFGIFALPRARAPLCLVPLFLDCGFFVQLFSRVSRCRFRYVLPFPPSRPISFVA